MKKQRLPLVILSVLIVMSLFLASCAAPTTPAATATPGAVVTTEPAAVTTEPVAGEPVTITFWHSYTDDTGQAAFLKDVLIPQFEAAYPNIKVKALQVAGNDMRSKLLTALVGGSAPDLMRADIIWVPEYGALGALEALDELMPDFQTYADAVFPGPLETNIDYQYSNVRCGWNICSPNDHG
jgi:multiple sugar transport system substrate-binding protein